MKERHSSWLRTLLMALTLFLTTAIEAYANVLGDMLVLHASGGGGVTVDNGGDVVTCDGEPIFVLDYLLASKAPHGVPLLADESWDPAALSAELWRLNPAMSYALQAFLQQERRSDIGGNAIWLPSDLPLQDIQDEELVQALPKECSQLPEASAMGLRGPLDIRQIIIRRQTPGAGTTIFEYDRDLLERLSRRSPLQLSYLMTHEWLWEFTRSALINRVVNQTLHSGRLAEVTADEFKLFTDNLGVSLFPGQPGADKAWRKYLSAVEQASACREGHTIVLAFPAGVTSRVIPELPLLAVGSLDQDQRQICSVALYIESGSETAGSASLRHRGFETTQTLHADGLFASGHCPTPACLTPTGPLKSFLIFRDLNHPWPWELNLSRASVKPSAGDRQPRSYLFLTFSTQQGNPQ